MVLKGIATFIFFGILAACYRDTKHFPNAMSSRELDSIKKGLKLAFNSRKLVMVILSNYLNYWSLAIVFRSTVS